MSQWLRRLRGAVGMGITWAIAWAVGGLMIGVTSLLTPWLSWERFFAVFDAPLPALAVPGFVGGAIFSVVLGIAARKRRFDELSLPKFGMWGALGGFMLSLVPILMNVAGLVSIDASAALLLSTISLPFTLLGAASATGSLALARRAEQRGALPRPTDHLLP
jgi:drug/metabolite transporter (DMT)-like permease